MPIINLKAIILCLTAALAAMPLLSGPDQQWAWQLPPERYKELSVFERSQYDKAADLIKQKAYKAAATEFEKFHAQFPDSKCTSYMLFMRGYCLLMNKDRGESVKVFNEVMDYFGDKVEDATPALFFMGTAHIENGDMKEGLKCMQEIVDDPDYSKHPLVAGALNALGNNCWKNNERAKAVEFWKRACSADMKRANQKEVNEAVENATKYYIFSKDYSGFEGWRVPKDKTEDFKHRVAVAESAWNIAWNGFAKDWDGEYPFSKQKEKVAAMNAFFEWFKKQKPYYEQDKARKDSAKDGIWTYYDRAIRFAAGRYGDKPELGKLVDEAVAYAKKIEDKADSNSKLARICEFLREAKTYELILTIADQISDRPLAEFKKFEAYSAQKDWEKAIARLNDVEGMGDDKWKARAMNARADTFAEMGRYEEAIKLYQVINQPPRTLWSIQECYRKWGKLEDALRTLTEIENSFPDEASKAAWQKAEYLDKAKEREKAIAQARRIMKVYPKSEASSKAHQLLEKYGIKTGGGVTDGAEGGN